MASDHSGADVSQQPVTVTDHLGLPTFHVSGQPNAGMAYMTGRPVAQHFADFGRAGVDFVSFHVSMDFQSNKRDLFWCGPDQFDYQELDARMAMVVEANPEALIFPRVYLTAPPWWLDAHPEACMQYHDGTRQKKIRRLPEPTAVPSWSSELWRTDMANALRGMIRHIDAQPYGSHVVGYHLASGGTSEWYYWPYHRWFFHQPQEDYVDYSAPQTEAFRHWLAEKYGTDAALQHAWDDAAVTLASATIAPKERKTRPDLFNFFDPSKSQWVVDTLAFEASVIADTIAYFCRVVKDETGGAAFTGAFYGYLLGADDRGYCATRQLLMCPDIDFLTAPSAYEFREPGTGYSTFRSPLASVQLHGKVWWDENDYYTDLTLPWKWVEGWTGPRNFATTETQQLRQVAAEITNAAAGWWFDMEGGWYDDPASMAMIERLNAIAERSVAFDRSSVAEIAVVVDETSLLYVHSGYPNVDTNNLYRPLLMEQRLAFGRMGAPADWLLLDDLDAARDYKVYVFLNAFHVTGAQRAAIDRLADRGARGIVWVYAAGLIGESLDARNCEALTGIPVRMSADKGPLEVVLNGRLSGVPAGARYGTERKIGPVLLADDPEAEVLGELYGYGGAGLVRKPQRGMMTYWSGAPKLSAVVLRQIAIEAGVHIYSWSEDSLYVNRSFIGLQAATDGRRTLYFEEPTDLYDPYHDHVVAQAANSVGLDMSARQSLLLFRGGRDVWRP